jgi:hypothetical protein
MNAMMKRIPSSHTYIMIKAVSNNEYGRRDWKKQENVSLDFFE